MPRHIWRCGDSQHKGHSSIRLTADTYSHVTDDMLEEAAARLGAAMFPDQETES